MIGRCKGYRQVEGDISQYRDVLGRNHSEQLVQADLRDIMGSVPDHRNKAGITMKQVVTFFVTFCKK